MPARIKDKLLPDALKICRLKGGVQIETDKDINVEVEKHSFTLDMSLVLALK